jgi:hypothetical protein
VLGQDLVGEAPVLFGHGGEQHGLELLRVDLAHALVLAGDDDVDAVGLVTDVLVDPGELDLELFGRKADGAEHAEAAGLADRRDHVAAVGEGEERELDAESIAEGGVHGPRRYGALQEKVKTSRRPSLSDTSSESRSSSRWPSRSSRQAPLAASRS